jgi:hypothetical protein
MLTGNNAARHAASRCRYSQWLKHVFHAAPALRKNEVVDRTGMPECYSRGRPNTLDFIKKIEEKRFRSYLA